MANQPTINIDIGTPYTLYSKGNASVFVRQIGVHPARQPAAKGDSIAFNLVPGDGRSFTVIFPDGSPFDTDEVHAKGPATTAFIPVTTNDKRAFSYYVAIATDKEVHLLTSGPEIRVS